MVNKDMKAGSVADKYQDDVVEVKHHIVKIPGFVKDAWNTFHKFGMWLTLALGVGIYLGVMASGKFYSAKMDDITLVGGMVHKQKVFSVTPR